MVVMDCEGNDEAETERVPVVEVDEEGLTDIDGVIDVEEV